MNGIFKKVISIVLAVVILLGAAPLAGFVGLELPSLAEIFTTKAEAAYYTSGKYTYTVENGKAIILDYYDEYDSITYVTVPKKLDGYPVVSIGERAFYYETHLKGVTIPDCVTSIGDEAFYYCESLKNVSIPNSVTSIGDEAFYYCESLENVSIPNSVTSIGEWAFGCCRKLTSIRIPNSVTYLGDNAFATCTNATELTISNSITSIGVGTFKWCTSLTNVTIPNSVTSIGDYAFYQGESIKRIIIPDSVTSIGKSTFELCKSLSSVTIPSNVTYIGCNAFEACSSLTNISILDSVTKINDETFMDCTSLETVTIPDSVIFISDSAFHNTGIYNNSSNWEDGVLYVGKHLMKANNTVSGSYTVKEGTIRIADKAFANNSTLSVIRIPSGISVGEYAFDGCSSLSRVILNEGLDSIGNYAFRNCSLLSEIGIPSGIKSVGECAFSSCKGLESVTIGDNIGNIGDMAFAGCTNLTDLTLGSNIDNIGESAFEGCTNLSNVTLGNNIKTFDCFVFCGCTNLTSLTINEGTESIGDYAFAGCLNLAEILIPASVTEIGYRAFDGCSALTDVNFAENGELTEIGSYAFSGCIALRNIAIPENITEISYSLFYGCTALEKVGFSSKTKVINEEAFYNCNSLSAITIPESTEYIGKNAFANCNKLSEISIPGSVKIIEEDVFSGCSTLAKVTLGDGVQTVKTRSFAGCIALSDIDLPDSITTIENDAFNDTAVYNTESNWVDNVLYIDNYLIKAKTEISGNYIVEDETKSIADKAFDGCISLTSVDIPEGVVSIGDYAFNDCSTLETMYIPSTVKIIGDYCCENATYFNNVYYDGSKLDWDKIEIGSNNSYLLNAIFHYAYYCITWIADGVETVESFKVGTAVTIPANPSKEYYTFSGWDVQIPEAMPEKNLTITAQFTPVTYYATFVIDGETFATVPYTVETESIVAPTLPVREGYTEIWEDYELILGGVTVNAIYSINPHTLTWNVDGEETTDNYEYGDTIVKPADPEKEGYTFMGWTPAVPATVPDEDLTFTAIWQVNNYTVTWNVDGVIKTENYDYGTAVKKPSNPVKEGYTFIGWTNDVPATMPANDLEFVAEWSINPHTVTWVIDSNETVDTYNFGDTIVKSADPEKEGYTFKGWDAEIPATVPDADLVFTATWQVNNYTVTWNVDGEITTETYDYGTKIVKPATPEKEGYTFRDWTIAVPATMPANNLDFVATWDINTYSIAWNIGDTVEATEFDYGEAVIPPEVNVDGYEFIKWIPEVPATMPAEDLEFTAMLASTAFDSGWGTEDNPYIISTKEQLDEARNHLGSSFKLANDIVFTESDFASGGAFYNSGRGWNPINLYGTFDGDGYVIRGLKINARITASTEYPYIGLFGMVSGTVKNLGLVDGEINVTVTNADEAGIGAIAAFADANSKITNCFNTCEINVTSTRTITVNYSNRTFSDAVAVGGIIGMGPAEISKCFNNGNVSVDASVKIIPNSYYTAEIDIIPVAGGITGGTSTVKDCYNTGDIDVNVTATRGGTSTFTPKDYLSLSAMAGGISGMMSDVTNCYNEGNVNATITDNYKSSNKLNVAIGGGIAAGVGENNTVSNCYNTGKVTGTTLSGAVAAYSEGTVENCYYLNNNDIGVGEGEDITVPCTPEEMASESTYEGFDFENTWVIGASGTPKLGRNTVSTEKVEINNAALSVVNKKTAQLNANLVPAYSTYQGVVWLSSDEDVATVDENGLVTAKKIGEATIKATSADGKAFAECKVTVTPADFTITWIVDGVETEETVTETKAIIEPETPVKYGYTFSGWTPDVPDVMPAENLTFSGTWIPVECELIFDATTGSWADGTTKKTETVAFDTEIFLPEAPAKPGYIFLGWALNSVNVGTDLGIMDDENGKRFTAVWVPSTDTRYAVETYTMNTKGEYVKTVQNFTGETDSTANAEYNIKTGFTLNTEKSVLNGVITADNSLVLKVYIDRNVYTFTTVVDGVLTETEYFYESTIAEPATPSKTGYTFVDWDVTVPTTMPAKNVTITAEFDANSYDAFFDANEGKWSDGSTSKTVATDFDSKIIAPANPTRQGYDFVGWNYEIGIMDNVNGKIFIAGWNARNDTKYTVETYTMDINGKYVVTTETKQGTTDSNVSVSANAATGFTFNSNKSVLNGTVAPDGSLVLSIYYDRNTYTFATVINGKTTPKDYYFNASVTKPANPVKPGYKFTGWDNTIPSKMPANDVTVTANFELSFKMSIRNPSTTTISYGDKIILHADMNEALPSGWKIKWTADNGNFGYSASGDGSTCTISPSSKGDTTFTATVYDENENVIGTDAQKMTSKAGFFDKIIAFFKGLFGLTKTIPQAFKGIF